MISLRSITPLIHPAAILRGRPALAPVQVAYLKRLVQGASPSPLADTSVPPPGCNPDPTLNELRSFKDLARFSGMVVLDIENAGPHLICCGMVRLHSDTGRPPPEAAGVCFRFRHQGGAPWWPDWQEHLEVVTLLDTILGDPDIIKVGHFIIQHDLPLLLDLGFNVRGPLVDTSVLCHAVHAELPKGLQFLATAFCGAPRWKDIPDEKEAAERDTHEGEEP